MRNFNFFEMLWEHGRTLRRVGLVLVMCLMATSQMWAGVDGNKTIFLDLSNCSWYMNDGYYPKIEVRKGDDTYYKHGHDEQISDNVFRFDIDKSAKAIQFFRVKGESEINFSGWLWIDKDNYDGDNVCCYKYYNYYIKSSDGNGFANDVNGRKTLNSTGGEGYFYAGNLTTTNYVSLLMGRWDNSKAATMSLVNNTEKLYYSNSLAYNIHAWTAIIGTTSEWTDANEGASRLDYASDHTYQKYGYQFLNGSKYYMTKDGTDPGTGLNIEYKANYSDIPTFTTTLNVKVKEGGAGSYSNGSTSKKPATTISLQGTILSSGGTSGSSRSSVTWTDGSSCSYNSVISGAVTTSYSSLGSTWNFDGWYINDEQVGTGTSYDFYQHSNTTVEARFTKKYTVTYYKGTGDVSGSAPSATTHLSGATVTVKDNTGLLKKDGKVFAGWATSQSLADAGTVNYDPCSASKTFTITSDVTLYPVWKDGYYLITPGGSSFNLSPSTPFLTTRSISSGSAVSVNGISSAYWWNVSSAANVVGLAYDGSKHLVYDTQTDDEDVYVYVRGTGNLHYAIYKEGVAYTAAASDTVAIGTEKVFHFSIQHSLKSRLVLSAGSSTPKIITVRVVKNGSALAAPCTAGYQLSFPGRAGTAKDGSIDGITLKSNSNLIFGTGNVFQPKTTGSHYAQFTTTGAIKLQVTTTDTDPFYVCTDKSSPSTTGVETGGSADTHSVNLSVAGTYYITSKGSNQLEITKIAFATITSCTAPSALAASDVTTSGVTLTVTDGSTRDYEFYVNTSSTAPTASSEANYSVDDSKSLTIDDLSSGTTYYAWARTKCDNLNKSSWVALGSPGYFTTATSTTYTVSAVTNTGTNTYGTVAATDASLEKDGTTTVTASPATGYKVTNWAVSGTGASISPSGASNATSTTLTMGTANATVTVTFGPKSYDLTLNKNHASASAPASTSSVNFDATSFTPTAPSYSGHTVDGYYTSSNCTTLVATAAGALQKSITVDETVWTNSSSAWKKDGGATFYAHWKCDAPTVTCTDNVVTMSVPSGATVYYTTDGSTTPTSGSYEYDPSNKPVIAANTTIKAIAIQSGCTSSSVTTQSCTYTAYSTSVNIEQAVLTNGTSWNYTAALTSANITYDLTPGDGESVSLDNLNYNCSKTDMNNDYRGLKIKSSGKYIEVNLAKGNTLKVRFGHRGSKVSLEIDEVAQSDITKDGNYFTYSLAKDDANNRVVRFTTKDANAVVIKQIMIGEDIATVDLPAQINIADGITNGSISAASTANVGSTVTVTVTPSTGYELATLTYQACTGDPQDINQSTKQFTMPNSKVTLNATFVLSCSAPTSPSISGTTSYTVGNTISLTASATGTSGSTTYTWYKGADWATASATSPVQAASTSGATFSKASCVVADAGKYWCNISNGTGCDVQVGQAITVAKADISPILTYDPSTLIQGVNSPTPTVTGNPGSGGVTYTISTSSPADIATVNSSTGVVSSTGTGTITVTATVASTTNYNSGTATFDLTIRAPYTVTFNPNGGSVDPTSATENSYDGVSLPTPTWASHTFQGWFLGETNIGKTGKFKPTKDGIYLYAGWKETCAGGADPGTKETIGFTTATCESGATEGGERALSNVTNLTVAHEVVSTSSGALATYTTANQQLETTDKNTKVYSRGGYKWNLNTGTTLGTSNNTVGFSVTVASGYQFTLDSISFAIGATANMVYQIIVYQNSDTLYKSSEYTFTRNDKTANPNHKFNVTGLSAQTKLQNLTGTFYVRARLAFNSTSKYLFFPTFQVIGNLHSASGGGTCYYVTYDGNGATSGYTSDPKAYEADDDPVVKTNGYTRTGYEFVGWNTEDDGSGTPYAPLETISDIADDVTLYAQWRILINSDNTDFSGYTSVGSADDVRVTNGATLTITSTRTIHDIIIDDGATLNVSTNSGSAITFTINSLHLKGGWNAGKTKYDMPRVYIDPKSSLSKSENTVNFDITVDQSNYYPIALPFDVAVNSVDYVNSSIASISTYGTHYAIKEYRGDLRAENGPDRQNNWKLVAAGSTLKAGKGYILSGLNVGGRAEIRFPLSFTNAWTALGEQGTVSAVTKNVVAVTAHTGKATEGDKYANKGWNLLGVPFMSCYGTSAGMYNEDNVDDPASIIQGKFNFEDGTWDGEDKVRYVNVPVHDFSEYIQTDITDAGSVLRPGWCFFVQIETSGNLKFLTADQAASSSLPIYAPKRGMKADMPTMKTGIVLSGNGASDKTTLLISDKYNGAEYEINADLEKMFGNGYTLATYSLSNDTRLAYNAMSRSDAQLAIPIGYRAPAEGSYTFSINPRYAESGAFSRVDLIDYEAGTLTNLLMSDYTFSTERTQNDTRFAINVVLAPQVTTDIESVNGEGLEVNGVRKVLINNELYIVVDGKMFDATGKAVR